MPIEVVRLELPLDAATFDDNMRRDPRVHLRVRSHVGDDEGAWAALSQAHVYHVSSAKDELPKQWFVTEALLRRCPDLVAVSTYGAGFDTVDVDACTRAGVCVINQSGSNAAAVAEHAFGLMLAVGKRMLESDRLLHLGTPFARHDMAGRDLQGATLGLVGFGHVGRRMAVLAQAFGMRVLATDPYVDPAEIAACGAQALALDDMLPRADIVSLHCPLDSGTAGMINAARFGLMKRGALFISTARGGVHDEAALDAALRSGQVGGAGLDVWVHEPPPPAHPLLQHANVVATHHTAGVTAGSRRAMATLASTQILQFIDGERPARVVNPQAWPACEQRRRQLFGALLGPRRGAA